MTNGDRIRQMIDEELAELLLWNVCTVCDGRGFEKCGDDEHCKKYVEKWLKQLTIEPELRRTNGEMNMHENKCSVCGSNEHE